jgi:aspartate racemase
MPRVLGILGGMGPEATILLMTRILRRTPARDDADHIPLLVDSNTQVPSRIRHLIERTGPDPTPTLVGMARRLEAAGAEALAMPCNTAHSYLEAVAGAVEIPFLDMPRLTAAEVAARTPDGPVGILASPAVEITGVFAAAFAEKGREALYPADRDALLGAIRSIKAGREAEALPVLRAACAELAAQGAVATTVACSEFSLLSPQLAGAAAPVFDSLDALTGACVAFALDESLPPQILS